MISEREINNAIAECEENASSFKDCEKLSVLYAVRDGMYGQQRPQAVAAYDSGSEFMRAINGKDWNAILAVIDELMDSVKAINPRLYDAVMRRI